MVTRLSFDDHAAITAAVHAAEAGTAGEIVTIVTDRSDAYHDAALHYAILAMLLVPILFAAAPHWPLAMLSPLHGGWQDANAREVHLLTFALMALVFLIVRYTLAWMPLRLALVPKATKARRARRHAIELFRVGAERRTTGRTGILIYLALAEHRAEIVADEAIHSKVAREAWGDAMAALIVEVREGRVAEGMIAAVTAVGAILAEHLPRDAADTNELPDRLIEL